MKTKMIGVSGAALGMAIIGLLLPGRMQGRQSNPSPDETAAPITTTAPATTAEPSQLPPAPATVPAEPSSPGVVLSKGAADIAQFAQSGVGQDVMLTYINNAKAKFALGSDQIVYLNDIGIPSAMIKAMIERDAAIDTISQSEAAKQAEAWQPQPPAPLTDTNPTPSLVDNTYPTEPLPTDDTSTQMPLPDPDTYAAPDDSDYFYTSLAPYGSWIYLAGYGVCWQPTVSFGHPEWQPYCDRGRWINSNCGWYWQSDYSWGWAPFHYGRWYNDMYRGWVWCPDKVWGPAWVSWRASGEYCGWAPLPPAAHFVSGKGLVYRGRPIGAGYEFGLKSRQYTFIPISRLSDYAPTRYAVASWQRDEICSQTHVITDITEHDHHLMNRGVDPQQVAALAHTQIRRAEILEMPHNGNGTVQSDRLGKRGDNLVIYRPELPTPAHRLVSGSASASFPSHHFGAPRTSTTPAAPATPMPHAGAPTTAAATAKANNDALMSRIMAIKQEGMAHRQAEARENYPNGSLVWRGNDPMNHATGSCRPETSAQPAHVPAGNFAMENTFGRPNNSEQHVPLQHSGAPSSSVYVIPGRQSVAQHQNGNTVPYWMNSSPLPRQPGQPTGASSYTIPGHYTAAEHSSTYTPRNESGTTFSTRDHSYSGSGTESHSHFESHSTPASHESYSSHSSSSGSSWHSSSSGGSSSYSGGGSSHSSSYSGGGGGGSHSFSSGSGKK